MIRLFKRMYARVDAMQRGTMFRLIASGVLSVAILVAALICSSTATMLHRDGELLVEALKTANSIEKNAVTKELLEQGTVTLGTRVYGSADLATQWTAAFADSGRIERVTEVAAMLLTTQIPAWMPGVFIDDPYTSLSTAATLIVFFNLLVWSGLFLQGTLTILCAICAGALAWWAGERSWAVAALGIPLAMLAFFLSIRIVLTLLDRRLGILAVASTVIKEAMAQRIAVAFAFVALGAIPLLPMTLDASSPLRYQVQTFLSTSLGVSYGVIAVMTLLLGCATVSFEIRDRTAWMTMVKPISRGHWLLGKCLGIVALSSVFLLVATLTTYACLLEVRTRPAQDIFDALAVREEVLVARIGTFPRYVPLPSEQLRAMVEKTVTTDPAIREDLDSGARREQDVKRELAREYQMNWLKQQRSLAPGAEQEYTFYGLSEVKRANTALALRYKFFSGASDSHDLYPVVFIFDGEVGWTDSKFVAAQTNVLPVPPAAIAADGSMKIRIQNVRFDPSAGDGGQFFPGGATIMFDHDGLELMHEEGGFEANLVRAQLVNLCKIIFLAMLAVCAASILSFPVAALVCFAIFAAGSIAPFLALSIAEYNIRTEEWAPNAFEFVIRSISSGVEFMLRPFGQAVSTGSLVQGRLVSWWELARAFALIGVGWSVLVFIVGWSAFRRKELAIYSGQGG